MLRRLTRTMRCRAAAALACAYLACVIWPPVALAFADGAVAAHCLTEDHHGDAIAHVHSDNALHAHHAASGTTNVTHQPASPHDHSAPETCCGLFSPSAMTPTTSAPLTSAPRATIVAVALEAALAGHRPARLDRPPNVPTSL
jgi:hypothetical protein